MESQKAVTRRIAPGDLNLPAVPLKAGRGQRERNLFKASQPSPQRSSSFRETVHFRLTGTSESFKILN